MDHTPVARFQRMWIGRSDLSGAPPVGALGCAPVAAAAGRAGSAWSAP
jgi:hypothetical protein